MIYINGTTSPQQPTDLNDQPERTKTDTYAIDNTVQRNQMASKKRARFIIANAMPSTWQWYEALYEAAAPVTFRNDQCNTAGGTQEFVGIIDVEKGEYIRGGSLMVELTITIREV